MYSAFSDMHLSGVINVTKFKKLGDITLPN